MPNIDHIILLLPNVYHKAFLFATLLEIYLLNFSKVIVSAVNPPTDLIISNNWSSLNPYLNWSLTYLS